MVTDTCNATERNRGKLAICEKRLDHPGNHRDGDHEWTREEPKPLGARVLEN